MLAPSFLSPLLAPVLFATVLWFIATGFVLWLDRLPSRTWPASLVGATVASGFAMGGVFATAAETSSGAAYIAFACALVIWGWHELSFLLGFVTGPNRCACPPDATGWRRFRLAAATLIHHEVAMFATALIVMAATWGQPNQAATLTFGLLFVMRLSAKFNIFAGVPHLSTEMMPEHMRYLASYFRTRPASSFFMLSLAGIAGLAAWLGRAALASQGGSATGYALGFGLAILGFVEHSFLVMPWQDTRLFRWAMRGAARQHFAIDRHNHNIEHKSAESGSNRQPDALAGIETARQYVQGTPHHGL